MLIGDLNFSSDAVPRFRIESDHQVCGDKQREDGRDCQATDKAASAAGRVRHSYGD